MPLYKSQPSLNILLALLSLVALARGQDCSATKLCATGCCSFAGFCGTTPAHCGDGCQSTCDFKLACDAKKPCKDGTCCSKFGFCGLGPQYCKDTVCVSNCDAKSYCDPGYGPEWSEIGDCPLRVCCSKWGYCGLTEEFCGDKKVERPSCKSADSPLRRVVGYYEGWAARRSCMRYQPGDIKPGVYTHLNFAFASINPTTFRVVPADPGDVALYSKLTRLKEQDPNLKVYIAIGGWDFTEPWKATRTTFSDIAGSTANQRAFFASLISFMATYNFDGVDIDWEYPVAEERSGRPEDFANFPVFIRNLKNALDTSSGGRNGLSITIPVSYWYLQHFDIIATQDHVEFFNVMSYDLHGTWDEGTNWTQPWLNSHTNLTEITDYLDLLWRNDIAPEKVTLGLAFYSRTFGLANPSCTSAGGACYFHSGGAPSRCSNNVGTLMAAEVKEILDTTGIKPVLDRTAAVKIFSHNGDWITFDDVDTWKLKIKFAQSQCLGGVLVWAVSQDSRQTYSNQLQEATGYSSPGVILDPGKHQISGDIDNRVSRPQCRWTGCGEGCGLGYYPAFRTDTDRKSNTEYMSDETHCRDGTFHLLCCPAYGPYAKCGWYDFWNGDCGGQCPSGFANVGSTGFACRGNMAQAACCTVRNTDQWGQDHGEITATALYANCRWEGNGRTDHCRYSEGNKCPSGNPCQVASRMGSGGDWCPASSRILYCCGEQTEVKRWSNCYWQQKRPDGSGYCHPTCPYPEVRVAMEAYPPGCSTGGWAYCCTPVYKTEAISNRDRVALFTEALEVYMKDPVCKGNTLEERDHDTREIALDEGIRSAMAKRQSDFRMPHLDAQLIFQDYAYKLINDDFGVLLARELINALDNSIRKAAGTRGHHYGQMNEHVLANFADKFPAEDRQTVVDSAICNFDGFSDSAYKTGKFSTDLQCDYIFEVDTEYQGDHDDGGTEADGYPNKLRRRQSDEVEEPIPRPDENGNWPEVAGDGSVYPYDEIYHELYGRSTGSSRGYSVNAQKNDANVIATTFGVRSSPYPNGNDGDELIRSNGDISRYLIKSTGCGAQDYKLDPNSLKVEAAGNWVSEHILELQAFARFLETAISGKYKTPSQVAGPSTEPVTKSDFYYIHPKIITPSFPGWNLNGQSPATAAISWLGSVDHPDTMVVCESALNAMKSRIFRFFRPVSQGTWDNRCAGTTKAHAETAFANLQRVFGVFDYYGDPNVRSKHRKAYLKVKDVLAEFEATDFRLRSQLQDAWKQYCIKQATYMGSFAKWWVAETLGLMSSTWTTEYNRALLTGDVTGQYYAWLTRDDIQGFLNKAVGHFSIDTSIFT